MNRTVLLITAGLIILLGFLYFGLDRISFNNTGTPSGAVTIEQSWVLPDELDEVSGMAFLGENKIACIQDEDGIIFIYDLAASRIEKEVEFGDSGDYEGIAVKGSTAYVLRSDGTIYEVQDFLTAEDPKVREIETRFSTKNNMEGLFFDKRSNGLLLAVKGKDPDSKSYKGIYLYDLEKDRLREAPAYKLTFEEAVFDDIRKKNVQNTFYPSEVARNPVTGEILLLDGRRPQLLILDDTGRAKVLHVLNKKDFPQPEGITFSKDGAMYISSEGNPGTIHKVRLK